MPPIPLSRCTPLLPVRLSKSRLPENGLKSIVRVVVSFANGGKDPGCATQMVTSFCAFTLNGIATTIRDRAARTKNFFVRRARARGGLGKKRWEERTPLRGRTVFHTPIWVEVEPTPNQPYQTNQTPDAQPKRSLTEPIQNRSRRLCALGCAENALTVANFKPAFVIIFAHAKPESRMTQTSGITFMLRC